MPDVLLVSAALGFARHIKAAPRRVERPTVIAATYSVWPDTTIFKGSRSVRAVQPEQAQCAATISIQDQIFAEHPNCPGATIEIPKFLSPFRNSCDFILEFDVL